MQEIKYIIVPSSTETFSNLSGKESFEAQKISMRLLGLRIKNEFPQEIILICTRSTEIVAQIPNPLSIPRIVKNFNCIIARDLVKQKVA